MNYLNAIDHRISRRVYLNTPIETEKTDQLRDLISEFNEEGDLKIAFLPDGSSAFNGLRRSYGFFNNVNSLIALIGKENDPNAKEKLGYYGEFLTLAATELGLGTCWVGGTFDRNNEVFETPEGYTVFCVITVGYVPEEKSFKENLIHKLTHRKTRPLEDLYTSVATPPEWFLTGMKAVQKAPSARNKQPAEFVFKNDFVTAFVPNINSFELIDLGIAKAHFVIAAGGHFEFGNHGRYTRD